MGGPTREPVGMQEEDVSVAVKWVISVGSALGNQFQCIFTASGGPQEGRMSEVDVSPKVCLMYQSDPLDGVESQSSG